MLALLLACRSGSRDAAPAPKPTKSIRDVEVDRALVLQSAIDRAKRELDQLEANQPRDERAIAEKKQALLALETTLSQTERRIEQMSGGR